MKRVVTFVSLHWWRYISFLLLWVLALSQYSQLLYSWSTLLIVSFYILSLSSRYSFRFYSSACSLSSDVSLPPVYFVTVTDQLFLTAQFWLADVTVERQLASLTLDVPPHVVGWYEPLTTKTTVFWLFPQAISVIKVTPYDLCMWKPSMTRTMAASASSVRKPLINYMLYRFICGPRMKLTNVNDESRPRQIDTNHTPRHRLTHTEQKPRNGKIASWESQKIVKIANCQQFTDQSCQTT